MRPRRTTRPPRCTTCRRLTTKAIREHGDCHRLVDLHDDCSDGPEVVLVACHHCRKQNRPGWARIEHESLTFISGLARGAGKCMFCTATICVAITGFPVSGGGDLSRGGLPDHITRSGRGPSPGHLPGHN